MYVSVVDLWLSNILNFLVMQQLTFLILDQATGTNIVLSIRNLVTLWDKTTFSKIAVTCGVDDPENSDRNLHHCSVTVSRWTIV